MRKVYAVMTLGERLRAAATAERLSDHIKVDIWLDVSLMRSRLIERMGHDGGNGITKTWSGILYCASFRKRPKNSLLAAGRVLDTKLWTWTLLGVPHRKSKARFSTREAAIRAGLLALAEREEAR